MRNNILSDEFWQMIELIVKILEPIVAALKSFESDTSTLSTVYSYYSKLIELLGEFSWNFSTNIQQLVEKRWEYTYHPIMMVAYMLDPCFLEKSQNTDLEANGYSVFTTFTNSWFNQEKSVNLFIELVKFRQKTSPYDNEII